MCEVIRVTSLTDSFLYSKTSVYVNKTEFVPGGNENMITHNYLQKTGWCIFKGSRNDIKGTAKALLHCNSAC